MPELSYSDTEEISALLMGRKVVKVADDKLQLDDGRILTFVGMADCCAYYDLTELNGVDNIITRVEFNDDPAGDEYPDGAGVYQIFVYADNKKINLATFEGTDSNGYYGTGYSILVSEHSGQST